MNEMTNETKRSLRRDRACWQRAAVGLLAASVAMNTAMYGVTLSQKRYINDLEAAYTSSEATREAAVVACGRLAKRCQDLEAEIALGTEQIHIVVPAAAPQAPAKLLESVPLDAETQAAIYDVCGQDPELFAAVMAIAHQESHFDPATVGDGGNSIGMMQINRRWQSERVEALGVTDLSDPVQNAAVAVDYLRELSEDYGLGWVHDHSLYMGYNMGPSGAKRTLRRGNTSSAYSREVMSSFDGYLAEMEAQA